MAGIKRALLAGVLMPALTTLPPNDARSAPAAPASCEATETGVPRARLAALAKGFNLTGWLDRKPGTAPDITLLRSLRSRGFTHVRLPVTAEYHLASIVGQEAAAASGRDLERAVDRLIALGFAVSLDMHPGEGLAAMRRENRPQAFGLMEGLWRRLASIYAKRPVDRIFFEILNEPTGPDEYREAVRMARAVRELARDHTLILGPGPDQRVEALESIVPIADRNVVYAIHFYDPMAFSHQGLDWSGPEDPLKHFRGVPFPSTPDHPAILALAARLTREGRTGAVQALREQLAEPWNDAVVDGTFARAEMWARKNKAAVIVNEFGVLSWQAPPQDRARWIKAVRSAAERHCIGWTHWDYADGFGFVRRTGGRESADPAILDALLGAVLAR